MLGRSSDNPGIRDSSSLTFISWSPTIAHGVAPTRIFMGQGAQGRIHLHQASFKSIASAHWEVTLTDCSCWGESRGSLLASWCVQLARQQDRRVHPMWLVQWAVSPHWPRRLDWSMSGESFWIKHRALFSLANICLADSWMPGRSASFSRVPSQQVIDPFPTPLPKFR